MSEPSSRSGQHDLSSLRIDPSEYRTGVRRRRVWIPILLLLLAMTAVLTFVARSTSGPLVETLTVPPPARPLSDVLLTATGYVVAARKAAVGAKIPGLLEYIGVEEGSTVGEGQVIARLRADDLEANVRLADARVLAARADIAQARAEQMELDREERRRAQLHEASVGSLSDLETAQAAAVAGRARIAALEERLRAEQAGAAYARAILSDASIVAPFAGVVLTKDAEVGESVAPAVGGGGTTRGSMVTMADMASLEVEADVSEDNIAALQLGIAAEIVLDAFPDRPYPAVLHQIVPTADRQRATVQVKVRFTGSREGALPEMSARVSFLRPDALTRPGPRAVITVPESCLRGEGEGRTVLRVQGDTVVTTPVTLAREPLEGQAEIVSGLAGGEEIVLSPPADLEAGSRVRVRQAAGR